MKASSLTSALVVRKGTALPSAATPQAFGPRKATATAPVHVLREPRETHSRTRPSALPGTMTTGAAPGQRRTNNTAGSSGSSRSSGSGGSSRLGSRPAGAAARVRMTLRMDPGEHLRLKLAAAHSGKNMTRIIDEAIAAYLSTMGPRINGGHCPCLARGPGRDDGDDAA